MIRKLHRAPDPELDAQLDLILKHLHDDRYSLLRHVHDDRYPLKATTLAGYGITDTYTKAEADSKFERPGTIKFVIRTTPWPGWLETDGSELFRAEYPNLWAEAQDSGCLVDEATWAANNWGCYSTGDGSTTFRIPLLNAEFIRIVDSGRGVDTGRTVGSWQEDAFQGHVMTASGNTGASYPTGANVKLLLDPSSTHGNTDLQTGGPISDGVNGVPRTANETRGRNIAFLGMIKY